MANKKITDLSELTTPASGDFFEIVDTSDTSESAEGTSKKVDFNNITIADASTTVKGKVELATDAETVTGTDTARAITPSNYKNAFDETLPAVVNAATSKTTPVDADEVGLVDSDASNVLKKLTWSNIKATLLTWLRLSTTIIPVNAPQGFLINGKISVTDAAGITVAIKTLAGANPSTTDPVYCRIGDTIRTISGALSVSVADGANTMNLGSAELATKEVDLFPMLGYNATDGVVIAFSRFPGGNSYDDFSTTATNEKYMAVSTRTNAAATDYYEVIGRFAATLSAGAGYTWTVPTYTAKNLIQRPIYETRWLDYTPVWTGFSSGPSVVTAKYKIVGRTLYLKVFSDDGASNATSLNQTLPFASTYKTQIIGTQMVNNSAVAAAPPFGNVDAGASSITWYKDPANTLWTASGNKRIVASHSFYEI